MTAVVRVTQHIGNVGVQMSAVRKRGDGKTCCSKTDPKEMEGNREESIFGISQTLMRRCEKSFWNLSHYSSSGILKRKMDFG